MTSDVCVNVTKKMAAWSAFHRGVLAPATCMELSSSRQWWLLMLNWVASFLSDLSVVSFQKTQSEENTLDTDDRVN